MSDLYNSLKQLDPNGIARLYFEATGDRPDAKINKDFADKIFKQALSYDDDLITDYEASALFLILNLAKFEDDAKSHLEIELWKKRERISWNSTDDVLEKKIAYALTSLPSSQIRFISPKTNIAYSPARYAAVYQLINERRIQVRALPLGSHYLSKHLEGYRAQYHPWYDRLTLRDDRYVDGKGRVARDNSPHFYTTVVHECTHAIQDWLDVKDLEHWQIETDAYIAEALAVYALRIPPEFASDKEHLGTIAYKEVGKLHRNGRWNLTGSGFQKVYDNVFDKVKVAPGYKDKEDLKYAEVKDDRKHTDKDGKPVSEKEIFEKLHEAAQKAATK